MAKLGCDSRGWYVRIRINSFGARTITRLHNELDSAICEIKEIHKLQKQLKKRDQHDKSM